MDIVESVSNSYEETLAFGAKFAKTLKARDVVCLFGDLGAGKTAFVKGMAKGLKSDPDKVHSPTFTLLNVYNGRLPVYHFDLYRIRAEDLFGLGYEEYFYGEGVSVVEWSERLDGLAPEDYWKVELQHAGENSRSIRVSCCGPALGVRFKKFRESLQ